MPIQTATNPTTGDRVALIDGEWKPFSQWATGPAGSKAYLVNGEWVTDTPTTDRPTTDRQTSIKSATEPGTEVPEWGRKHPELYGIAGAARETLGPLAEIGGMIAGGTVGSGMGPAGAVGGAGLGYGMGKSLTRAADVALGNRPPEQAAQAVMRGVGDVLEGATFETGGRVLGQVLPPVVNAISRGIGKGAGKVADVLDIPGQRAARIARDALGPDIGAVKAALAEQPSGVTAAQATADINSPTWQALIDRALKRDPRFLNNLAQSQGEVSLNALRQLVGGETQTTAKVAQEASKQTMKEALVPGLNVDLEAANTAGVTLPKLQGEADRMAAAAANKVEDVRRFTAVQPRAQQMARTDLIERGLPVGATKYTYIGGDLPLAAENVAKQSAEASLRFGESAALNQYMADSLSAHGLKPLKSQPIISSIKTTLETPDFAGNKDLLSALSQVGKRIEQLTSDAGVIDSRALDSVRKNYVNDVVSKLTDDPKAQKQLAAKVLASIKQPIVSAIENAGGTGYGNFIKEWAKGEQGISQQKLAAKAMDLFTNSPKKFVSLVQGNSPKDVEKIFGAGNYDIVKQMAADAMSSLETVAGTVARDKSIAKQASSGKEALRELLMKDMAKWRLPSYLSVAASSTNKALDVIEERLGRKTMDALTEAAKSGRTMQQLLNTLPATDRVKLLNILSNPKSFNIPADIFHGSGLAASNSLSGNENRNNLRPD